MKIRLLVLVFAVILIFAGSLCFAGVHDKKSKVKKVEVHKVATVKAPQTKISIVDIKVGKTYVVRATSPNPYAPVQSICSELKILDTKKGYALAKVSKWENGKEITKESQVVSGSIADILKALPTLETSTNHCP